MLGVQRQPLAAAGPRGKTSEKRRQVRRQSFPDLKMLIEIAILEKRNDDAVLLYQETEQDQALG